MLEKYGIGAEVLGAALARLVSHIEKIDAHLADPELESDQQLKLMDAQLKRISELRQWAVLERRMAAEAARAQSEHVPNADEDDLTYTGNGEPRAGALDWVLKGATHGDGGSAHASDLCFGYEAKARRRINHDRTAYGPLMSISDAAAWGAEARTMPPHQKWT